MEIELIMFAEIQLIHALQDLYQIQLNYYVFVVQDILII